LITQAAVIIMRKLEAANQGGFYESHRPTKERERELEREQGRSCNYRKSQFLPKRIDGNEIMSISNGTAQSANEKN